MDSQANYTTTVYNTISQYKNSDIEIPDKFADSESSPSTFSQPPFQPLHTQTFNEPSSAPSSHTDETPTYSTLTSDPPDHSRPVDTEFEIELDNFITLQQQLHHCNNLTIHHLSQTTTCSESSNPTSTTGDTRAHRVFERKFPDIPSPSKPQPAQTFTTHPLHTNTKQFLQVCLPFFLNIPTTTRILTTNNQFMLTKMPFSPHFHGPHF